MSYPTERPIDLRTVTAAELDDLERKMRRNVYEYLPEATTYRRAEIVLALLAHYRGCSAERERAVIAEREACADMAQARAMEIWERRREDMRAGEPAPDACDELELIAEAIRKRGAK